MSFPEYFFPVMPIILTINNKFKLSTSFIFNFYYDNYLWIKLCFELIILTTDVLYNDICIVTIFQRVYIKIYRKNIYKPLLTGVEIFEYNGFSHKID